MLRRGAKVIGVWWALVAAAWGCEEPTPPAVFAETLAHADQAFMAQDAGAFLAEMVFAREQLGCLSGAITAEIAAEYHRLTAMDAYFHKDELGTIQAFSAMVAIDPEADLAPSIAPEGHPLRKHLETARGSETSTTGSLERAEGHRWWIDGRVGVRYPLERPFILQHEHDGIFRNNAYLAAHAALPEWTRVETNVAPPRVHPTQRKFKKRAIPFFVAAGGTAVLAGGAFGYAWTQHSAYFDEDTPPEDRPGLRQRANGSTIAAGALGGVALGLGSVGLVMAW